MAKRNRRTVAELLALYLAYAESRYRKCGRPTGQIERIEIAFGPALKLPWTKLEAPELTDELIDKVVEGCEYQAAGRPVSELDRRRDDFLVELLDLVQKYRGAGEQKPHLDRLGGVTWNKTKSRVKARMREPPPVEATYTTRAHD